jgi:uncharacterized membrane protein (DUF2068 family)
MRVAKKEDRSHVGGLRAVATMELVKGLVVVALGFGLIELSHRDIDLQDLASSLLWILHVGPERRLYGIFMDAAVKFDDTSTVRVAIAAAIYSTLRFVESYGLWRARVWAEWFALVSGSIYLPLEIYEIARRPTVLKWIVLIVNIVIVSYMAWLRLQANSARKLVPRTSAAGESED